MKQLKHWALFLCLPSGFLACGQNHTTTNPQNSTTPSPTPIIAPSPVAESEPDLKPFAYTSSEKIFRIYFDKVHPGELLLKLSSGGYVLLTQNAKPQPLENHCELQDDYFTHYEWANPFLVSADTDCRIDSKASKIETVAKNPSLVNAYATAYLGRDDHFFTFLINSHPMKSPGFVHVKKIKVDTGVSGKIESLETSILVDQIKPYSGPMSTSPDGRSFWYTAAIPDNDPSKMKNVLYQINLNVFGLPNDQKTFDQWVQGAKSFEFTGLASYLMAGSRYLMYLIEEDEKVKTAYFLINRDDGKKLAPPTPEPDCSPAGLVKNQVYFLCGGTTIKTRTVAELLKEITP